MDESESTADTPERYGAQAGDTFETTREELRTTFEYQVQRLREIDTKAIEILKANLLLFGIVVTAGSILVQTDITVGPFLNAFTLMGILLLLLSTALAGITYTSSNLRGGMDADAIEQAIEARHGSLPPAEFEDRLLRSYSRWIEHNARMTAVNDMFATVTILFVIVSFVYIGAGFVVGIVTPDRLVSAVAFVVLTLVLTWLSRRIYHMDHLARPADRPESFDGVRISKGATRREGLVALGEMLRPSEDD